MNRRTSNYTLTIRTAGSAAELLPAVLDSMARSQVLCTNSRLSGEVAVVSYRTSDDEAAKRTALEILAGLPTTFSIEGTRIHTGLGINHRDVA